MMMLFSYSGKYNNSEDAGTSCNGDNFVWKINGTSNPNVKSAIITGIYRSDIFSKMVGVLTLNGFDILNAKSYRQNNKTIDIFNVRPVPGIVLENKRFERAERDLKSVLSGSLNLSEQVRKKTNVPAQKDFHVVVNNKDSSDYTVIEVSAYDFPGILFRITEAIFNCELDVWSAKITTKADRVADFFYVKDFSGQKADSPDRSAAIKNVLENALSGNRL